ncbi:MAG: TAXI family TRAP transporter solute-binding subunit, partial [Pseudomonadota bacterium]
MVTRFVGLVVCCAWVWLSPALACERPTPQSNAQHRIVIASGELQGLYNPIGGALCRIASNTWAEAEKDGAQDKRCAVRPTQGSSENLALLTSCQVDFAIL